LIELNEIIVPFVYFPFSILCTESCYEFIHSFIRWIAMCWATRNLHTTQGWKCRAAYVQTKKWQQLGGLKIDVGSAVDAGLEYRTYVHFHHSTRYQGHVANATARFEVVATRETPLNNRQDGETKANRRSGKANRLI
jgi:hypothetical protein